MKYSKVGILKKKVSPGSDVLEEEAKLMEAKLAQLRDFMKNEKSKRETGPKPKDGSRWRSGTQNKPNTNYADLVLSYKPKPGSSTKEKRPKNTEEFVSTSSLLGETNPSLQQNEPEPTDQILEFLQSCGLEKYLSILTENGIDELEILLELNEEHLNNLNIPLGHRLKILKKIRDYKNQSSQSDRVLEPLPASLENLPMPRQNYQPTTKETGIGDSAPNLRLIDGEFNQAESDAMFREALDNFRKGGSMTKHDPNQRDESKELKKVRFVDPVTAEMLPKGGSKLFYNGAWDPEQAALPEKFDEGSGPNKPLISEKKSC